jgi:Family of unknown function (DUF6527)
MIRYRHIEHRFVDDIPEQLDPGVFYVSMRYATAVHLCCCGCGREVVTPLSPAQWRLTFDGENVSLHPSVGNWNLPCRSHYVLSSGQVIAASSWSDEEVAFGQARDRRARMAYYASKGHSVAEQMHGPNAAPRKSLVASILNFFRGRRLRDRATSISRSWESLTPRLAELGL